MFEGSGTVNILQYKAIKGGINVSNGTTNVRNAIFDNNSDKHILANGKAKGAIVNSLGSSAFNEDNTTTEFIVLDCYGR